MSEPRLGEGEMVDILEEIARTGTNAAARIAAIKALREMGNTEESTGTGFDELYPDEIAARRKAKSA